MGFLAFFSPIRILQESLSAVLFPYRLICCLPLSVSFNVGVLICLFLFSFFVLAPFASVCP